MMETTNFFHYTYYICVSLTLSIIYVFSLYVWEFFSRNPRAYPRDCSPAIIRRFISVLAVTVISPLYVYIFCDGNLLEHGVFKLLGFKFQGFMLGVIIPLFLTAVLFLGPLATLWLAGISFFSIGNEDLSDKLLARLKVARNIVVGPFSEEFVFRACMVPLLLPVLSSATSMVLISPLFFGVAHAHHAIEFLRNGYPIPTVLINTLFQLTYTSIFGAYSTFLFIRTGHFVSPLIAHCFCNHMGFPDLSLISQTGKNRKLVISIYIFGMVSWLCLLYPITNPILFGGSLFWDLLV